MVLGLGVGLEEDCGVFAAQIVEPLFRILTWINGVLHGDQIDLVDY